VREIYEKLLKMFSQLKSRRHKQSGLRTKRSVLGLLSTAIYHCSWFWPPCPLRGQDESLVSPGKIHVYIYKGGCDQNFYQLLFVALINAGSLQLMEFLMPGKEVLLKPPPFLGPWTFLVSSRIIGFGSTEPHWHGKSRGRGAHVPFVLIIITEGRLFMPAVDVVYINEGRQCQK